MAARVSRGSLPDPRLSYHRRTPLIHTEENMAITDREGLSGSSDEIVSAALSELDVTRP